MNIVRRHQQPPDNRTIDLTHRLTSTPGLQEHYSRGVFGIVQRPRQPQRMTKHAVSVKIKKRAEFVGITRRAVASSANSSASFVLTFR